jgi:lipopolysaccharide transport protein LptA
MRAIIKMIGLTSLAGLSLLVQAEPAPAAAPVEAAPKAAENANPVKGVVMPEEIRSKSERSSVNLISGVITLEGNAEVWDKDRKMTISADRLLLTLDGDQKPVKIEAIGNVVFVGKMLMAGKEIEVVFTGGYGIYKVLEQELTLTEKPRVVSGRSLTKGMEKIIYDKKIKTYRTEGGTTSIEIFTEDIPKSKDDAKPAAGKLAEPAK